MSATGMHEKVQFGPSRKKDASLFLDCFRGVTKHREYWNKWVVDECWIDVINERYDMPESIRFTAVELNRAISRNAGFQAAGIDSLTLANSLGVYKSSYRPPKKPGTSRRRVTGYYITTPGNKPSEMPGGNSKWYTTLVNEMPSAASTRQNPIKRNLPEELTPATTPVPALKKRKGIATRRSNPKNVRINNFESTETKENVVDLTRSNNGQFEPPTQVLVGHKHKTSADIKPSAAATAVANQSWWESPEAHVLFCDVKRSAGENGDLLFPREYVETRIERLKQGFATAHGWKLVVQDFDARDLCTPNDIFTVQMKCKYVSLALRIALEEMPGIRWMQCCERAIQEFGRVEGHDHIGSPKTVQQWHLTFRRNNESFLNPKLLTHGKVMLPPLLDRNPELKKSLLQYATANLNELTAELLLAYIHDTALPALLEEYREELECPEYTMYELLKEHRLTKLSIPTIYRWMSLLRFKYEPRKKCYYVDGHEKPETKAYRKKFIKRYFQYERLMHRWIQMELTDKLKLEEEEGIELAHGYHYVDPESQVRMVELHVDDHHAFQDKMNLTSRFGGKLSVQKQAEEKPIICFGQDEAIMKQYCFTTKAWTAPTGQKAIVPKDEGMGVMISAFVSREFGFGIKLTQEQLSLVNQARRGTKYSDESAAKETRGKADKLPLTSSPFVVEFEYGANNQGYWRYDHMILQFEDCIDVVRTLWPEFEYVFLFDHSCGHDRQRPDGLTTTGLNKGFGGAQPRMRDTKIGEDDEVGRYATELTLKVGELQSLQFSTDDIGPCWMTPAEREATRKDRPSGKMKRTQRKVVDLKKDLQAKGVLGMGDKKELQRLCSRNDVPIETSRMGILEGWEGKAKGMLQMLFERGRINPKGMSEYTVDGRNDAFGNLIVETSLRHLMEQLGDFQDEETLMQYHGRRLGVKVDRTPKCHPEMAGEGVEYDWAAAKGFYRRLPISEKRSKAKFRESVSRCLDSKEVLTMERQRMFSRRAREYMVAYHAIDNQQEDKQENSDEKKDRLEKRNPLMTAYLIEKIVKVFKTHRSTADFDCGFVAGIVNTMKGLKEVEGSPK
jgi:hypothetical protein